ncbi:unnamed protein product [Malus baccata var. baccata]
MTTPSAPSLASSSRWASTTSVSSSGKRIQREMVELNMDPPPDCCAGPKGDNLYHWIATLFGPPGTPYHGGIYFLDITFPSDYPFKPPKVVFTTRIYHCNVDSNGNLSMEMLKDSWSPALTITKLLLAIRSIFTRPDPSLPVCTWKIKLNMMNLLLSGRCDLLSDFTWDLLISLQIVRK